MANYLSYTQFLLKKKKKNRPYWCETPLPIMHLLFQPQGVGGINKMHLKGVVQLFGPKLRGVHFWDSWSCRTHAFIWWFLSTVQQPRYLNLKSHWWTNYFIRNKAGIVNLAEGVRYDNDDDVRQAGVPSAQHLQGECTWLGSIWVNVFFFLLWASRSFPGHDSFFE